MKFLAALLSLPTSALAVDISPTLTQAQTRNGWPRITESTNPPLCQSVLALARAATQTSQENLERSGDELNTLKFPGLMLWPSYPNDFTKSNDVLQDDLPERPRTSVFTPVASEDDWKLAIVRQHFNWRGDWHAIYAIKGDEGYRHLTASGTLVQVDTTEADNATVKVLSPLNSGWIRPWLWQSSSPSTIVAIRPNPNDWEVFTANSQQALACRIAFYPAVENAFSLLPADIRKLARTLDEILGPDEEPGPISSAIRPVAETRFHLNRHTWPNLAFRPHATHAEPYNTWPEISAGLTVWAKNSPAKQALLTRFHQQQPAAERALTRHYIKYFDILPAEAETLARRNLDNAIRSYFTFPKPAD